jgi:tetratricopeptide (TPR) repeat protein
MPYQLEHDGVTYRNNGDGWHVKDSGEIAPTIISEKLNSIHGDKLRAKEDKITDPKKLLQLAAKYRKENMLDRAMSICGKIIEISPDSEEAASTVMSSILRLKGEPEEAVRLTEKFSDSNNPALLTTRAAALCDIEEWESAKKTIAKALAILKGESKKREAFGVVRRIKSARPELYER